MKIIKCLFLSAVIVICLYVISDIFRKQPGDEIPPIYKSIIRPSEVIIIDLESGEHFYTQERIFDPLARWQEDDYQIEEPETVQWKYKFYFRGLSVVEVDLAKEYYYKINDKCYKLNEECPSDGLYNVITNCISLSIEGYDCAASYWCTKVCESNE